MEMEELTWREQEVLALLAERLTNREIAGRLHLAESTVKEYVSNILAKLYVKNRRQAVVEATRRGLFAAPSQEAEAGPYPIPAYTTPIVGRNDELKKISQLFAHETRLITLTGPGGSGKSRLAVRAAELSAANYRHGAFFVALAPIPSAEQLIQTIAEALGFPLPTYEDATEQLIRYLQKKELLLILDNFEHLLTDGVLIIERILRSASGLHVLATSRERLAIKGEVNLPINGLSYPNRSAGADLLTYEAVSLFAQCAKRNQPTIILSPETLTEIAAICRLIQGMPLAIELAAAWLNVLTTAEILTEIEQGFDILARDSRGVDERHASIRAIFEHSWSMLTSEEQALFRQVAIFRDGFTRAAATAVAGATLPTLRRLVNKSMIAFDGESRRYQVHELLRQYGLERLASLPAKEQAVQERHAAYYADFMAQHWELMRGSRQLTALRALKSELANVRAAWRYYLQQTDAGRISQFLNSFWLVYWLNGWNLAAANLFEQGAEALTSIPGEQARRARAHAMAHRAFFLAWLGLAKEGYALARESIELLRALDNSVELYFAHHGLTLPAYYLERFDEEKRANDSMRRIAEAIGDQWLQAFAEFVSSVNLLRSAEYDAAQRLALAGLNRSSAIEDLATQSLCFIALGHLADARGERQAAHNYFASSLERARKLDFQWAGGNAIKYLGRLALRSNDLAAAESYFLQSLNIANELGLERDIANHLLEFAQLRAAQNRISEAVTIIGKLLTLPTVDQARLGGGRIQENAQKLLTEFQQTLAAEAISAGLARGERLALQELLSSLAHSS